MNAVIKGAKAGEGKARKAVIAPDSAQSKTYIKILYGLSEGEVEGLANGLQSVYLEETPLQNPTGGWNFEDVQADFRHGTNDQTHIEGFPDISSETAINVELKSDTPWVRSVTNTDLDAIRLRFKWGPLREQNAENGDVKGIVIQYAIDLQTDGGTWTEVLNTQIADKTSANYERSHRIDLPKSDTGWTVRVRRITPNSTSEYISDKMYVDALTEVIDLKLSYPNTALLGLQYDAETFSNVAKVAVDLKGIKLQVPSNYDPVARTYAGMWDGTFKRAYTNNPAWIYYDICTAKRYALGDRLTSAMLDKWSLYRLAQYCDQMVDDGKGGQEPRFTCNVYLQSTEDAYTILSKLAGVFRAISYWDGNSIVCDADIPQDTYFTYTRANVIDGLFEYSGTRARDRHTVAKVAWDNPANHYKTEYVYVRDEAAIAKLGVRIAEIDAWGCTSEGQAQRAGLWALKSEQLETRTVSFKVGLDGYIPQPGRVIEIADELFAGRANGGRIFAVSADRKVITLDRDDVVCRAGDRLVVNGENGKAQARIVSSKIGRNVTVTVAFDSVAAENVWAVDAQDLKTMKFRVMSITQDDKHQFSITALQYESAKYDAIDFGAFIDERPISIINPTVQAPVESVSITSETMVQQGLAVETMIISWPQAQGATKYQAEWRKDDGTWIKLPITGNNSAEVPGIYAGNYEARVTAISAFDIASLPTYSILTALTGKQGLPPALANLSATGILFGYRLNWSFPAVGALDTAYTEIEISSTANGANAAQLGLFAYPTTTHDIQGMQPNLTRFFRGRLIDRIGNIGPWSNWVSATTSADASAVLDILSGKISETQLAQDLATKIADIDQYDQRISDAEQAVVEVENQVSGILESQENIIDEQGILSEKVNGVYARVNPLTADGLWTVDSTLTEATAWDLYSAQILGDQVIAERVSQVQTQTNGNTATVQEVAQSVNGLYAQKYIKLDVNGKVAGWGGANDGKESNFILNFDSFAIGSGNSTGYYPFIFRNTPFTDPVTGTVFPVSAYLKSAMMDYESVKTSHIEDLAVKTAKIDDLAVTTAKIGDLQVDTLKIKDNAVTVPVGVRYNTLIISTDAVRNAMNDYAGAQGWRDPNTGAWQFPTNLQGAITVWEAATPALFNITVPRAGGKCRIDLSLSTSIDRGVWGGTYVGIGPGNQPESVLKDIRMFISLYRGGTLIGRTSMSPTTFSGSTVGFIGNVSLMALDDAPMTGNAVYTGKISFGYIGSISNSITVTPFAGTLSIEQMTVSALEIKK
ncbi:host specificity protein J [Acinetobacter lwoffii]|uniref:host specificity protein J n=1 Tax=Acinetobacter lwoffii TaxID=28090 RepID=UPI0018A033EF|nr:host specificity protein J [Acinetobacter lwoffii]QPF33278.1 host specificity protein J [Acinetobacter lwoffii]